MAPRRQGNGPDGSPERQIDVADKGTDVGGGKGSKGAKVNVIIGWSGGRSPRKANVMMVGIQIAIGKGGNGLGQTGQVLNDVLAGVHFVGRQAHIGG